MKRNERPLQHRIHTLTDALGSAGEEERRSARAELAEIGRDAVGPLVETLKAGNETARWEAAFALSKIGPDAAAAVPALSKALHDVKDFPLRGMVIDALGAIGPPAADAVPDLISALGDSIPLVSRSAAKALGEIRDVRAISPLELASTTEPPPLCDDAGDALGKIEKDLPQRMKILIEKFASDSDDEEEERSAACGELIYFGRRAIPALIEALGDRNENVRYFAARTLRGIGEAENAVTEVPLAVPALIRALQDSTDESVRAMAARAIGAFGAGGVAGTAALIAASEDSNDAVRESAITSLGRNGGTSAIPTLEAATKDYSETVSRAAQKALESIRTRLSARQVEG